MTTSLHNTSHFPKSRKSRRPLGQPRHIRLSGFESLEDRIVFNTYWASNLADSGAGSLRDAIESANGHTGAGDMRVPEEMKGTITLSSELSITDSLTIHGRGSDKLTVSGGGTTRVINIAAGADVTIEHLTIANGFVNDGDGAEIMLRPVRVDDVVGYVHACRLSLNRVVHKLIKCSGGGLVAAVAHPLVLKQDAALKLKVVGHTDMVGTVESNMALSQARAEAVVQVLVSQHGMRPRD